METGRAELFRRLLTVAVILAGLAGRVRAEGFTLENGRLRAEFNDRGLVSLADVRTNHGIVLSADPTSLTVNGERLAVDEFGSAEVETKPAKLTFRYTGPWPPYNFVNIRLKLERAQEAE